MSLFDGLLMGLGSGLASGGAAYQQDRAIQAAREAEAQDRAMRLAEFEDRKRQNDQAFQLDQRRLSAAVTEMGEKQRLQQRQGDAQQRMLQGLATTDRGELGEALRAAALAGGGQQAFRDMNPDDIARLVTLSTRETPEERQARELANIIAREKAQQQYSERLVAAAAGGAGRQTPDQAAARDELRHAETNVRGADRDFRRVVGRRPVMSETRFFDKSEQAPDTVAFRAALDAWRADSTDAAHTRDEARDDLTAAERTMGQLFPGLGRFQQQPAQAQAKPEQPLGTTVNGKPTLSYSRDERIAFAEREYDALVAAGISRPVAARSVAAKWGNHISEP
jgi:hypothetical protein